MPHRGRCANMSSSDPSAARHFGDFVPSSAVNTSAVAVRLPEGSNVSEAPPVKPVFRPDGGVKYARKTVNARFSFEE